MNREELIERKFAILEELRNLEVELAEINSQLAQPEASKESDGLERLRDLTKPPRLGSEFYTGHTSPLW